MGDSLDSYRSRIGVFAGQLCRKMLSSACKARRKRKIKEEWMAFAGIQKDNKDYWCNFLTLLMILVTVLSFVDMSISTVSLVPTDCAPLCQRDGAAFSRPMSVSVMKSLLLESGLELNPGPNSNNEESSEDDFIEEGENREVFFDPS